MDERTEEAGMAGLLTITVGGQPVELPVLTLEQDEEWQRQIAAAISRADQLETSTDGGTMLGNMLVSESRGMLDAVMAFDIEGRLGDRESLRKRMTKQELRRALEAMVDADNPSPGLGRSVVEAFGLQGEMVQMGLRAVRDTVARSLSESSSNGHSPSGDLTPELSVVGSPPSSSSSSGATARSARGARTTKPK